VINKTAAYVPRGRKQRSTTFLEFKICDSKQKIRQISTDKKVLIVENFQKKKNNNSKNHSEMKGKKSLIKDGLLYKSMLR